jgi:hypothetical protein
VVRTTASSKASALPCSRASMRNCLHNLLLLRSNNDKQKVAPVNGEITKERNITPALHSRLPRPSRNWPIRSRSRKKPPITTQQQMMLWPAGSDWDISLLTA